MSIKRSSLTEDLAELARLSDRIAKLEGILKELRHEQGGVATKTPQRRNQHE